MEKTTLARPTLAAILAHARERHPEECCGAVVEADGRDRLLRFTNIQGRLHAENPADFPRDATTAYTPEPRELLEAIRAGEQPGARLKIFYHSHSKNGAYFSGEDRARGMFDGDPAYPDVSYLVVSDAREPGEARAFRWDEPSHDFVESTVEVTGATPGARRATKKTGAAKARPTKKPATSTRRKKPRTSTARPRKARGQKPRAKKHAAPKKRAARKKPAASKKRAATRHKRATRARR